MARLYLTFKDNELTAAIDGIATTDTIGLEGVAEFFEWEGYSKTIVFYQNPRKPYHVVCHMDEFTFTVPHEVLTTDGPLVIGAFGVTNDGKRKVSTLATVVVTKGMYDESAIESIEPTPTEYEQMLAFMNAYMEAEKLVDSVAEAAEQATEIAKEAITVEKNVAIEEAKAEISNASEAEKAEIETLGEEIIERAEGYADAAELSSIEAANSVGRISSAEKRLSNIEQSITPSPFVVDDSVAYAKAVPVNALPYAEVNEIGGASRACTNIFNLSSAKFISINYGTASVVGDTLTVTGCCVGVDCYHLRAGVRYTLKVTSTRTGEQGGGICVMQADSAGNTITGIYEYANVPSSSISFTVLDNTYRVRLIFYGSNVVADRTNSATFTNIMLNEGNTALPYEPYFDGLISAPVTEVRSIGGNEVASLTIPDAVRNLKGYGEGNPNNPAECNKIDFESKVYHHVGDIVDGAWASLASPEVIDVSDILPLDNYIEVFEGGVVYMENEHKLDVPNTITFQLPMEIGGGGGGGGGGTGENGATFYPSVSSSGIISWTNDNGLSNPAPVNIKGKDGYTPVKGVDYYTAADKAEMVEAVLNALPDGDEVSY